MITSCLASLRTQLYHIVIAMYKRNLVVTVVVLSLFVAEIAAMCTFLVITIPKFSFNQQCIVTSAPSLFSSYW